MKSMRWALGLAGWAVLAGLATGCAKSSEAPAAAPAQEGTGAPGTLSSEPEPQTLADAEALLERSRADIDRLALNGPAPPPSVAAGAVAPSSAVPAPAPASAAPAPRDEVRSADKAEAEAPRAQAKEVNACETACKAFSSLTRASDAVCRLDAEGGQRCARARQIQQDASRRVASCSCTQP
jgi:hypothetical protein